MQNYFEKDYLTIRYDESNQLLIMIWITPSTSSEFRDGMNALLGAIEHFKIGKLISDTTKMGTLHPDDQTWVATSWFETAVKAGYSHSAIIVPSDVFTQMSVEDIVSQVINPIPTAYFENIETALEWIMKQ